MAKGLSLWTVPAGVPFVDALAAGLRARFGPAPLDLAGATVLLPTRRACRALAEAFLRGSDGEALLLPRMMPIGDMDEAPFAAEDEPAMAEAAALPPAIPDLSRRMLLSRLILRRSADPALWSHAPVTPAQAALLADGLASFLDQVQTERLSFDRLAELVPERFAAHWQITLDFLRILTDHWPGILAEEGCIDPAERRNRLIEARCESWRARPPEGPVIAAGSTGTVPATADLLALVAALPAGAVVLPGLDRTLGADAAAALPPSHPQAAMARLLQRLGAAPADVAEWPAEDVAATPPERAALIAAALRPPAAAPAPLARKTAEAALEGVRLVSCPGPQEEAGVIALAMRRALETPGRTAALVTPDRALARRVAAELRRWDVEIDDSAGTPLADAAPGVFLRLAAAFAAERAAPVPLLALFKHPLAAGGEEPAAFRARARLLERAALRGPRPAQGFDGLRRAVADHDAADALLPWLDDLEAMATPLMTALGGRNRRVADILSTHAAFAEALAAVPGEAPGARLWSGEAGEVAAGFVSRLHEAAEGFAAIDGADYAALFEALIAGEVVRPRYGLHPRLHIWGLLEARLQHADLLCLGGLNEGSWPPEAEADPWLSRPMRAAFGLPLPERRIGLAAHDFAQAFSAPGVLLTRATRVEGTPTVSSRWLLRIANTLDAAGLKGSTLLEKPGDEAPWLGWQVALDRPEDVRPMAPPEPRPPVRARPRRLSVTQVETWMGDPYAIYARHVLKLQQLDPIDAPPGAAERGTVIHDALDAFLRAWPDALPDDIRAELLAVGRRTFGRELLARPGVRAFWWPRFERVADWFAENEPDWRADVAEIRSEVAGRIELPGPEGPFTLTAKADRIDRMTGGGLAIIDYKTGTIPPTRAVADGTAPQLPLEAAMAREGGFDGVPAGEVAALAFWQLGGGEPPGEIKRVGNDVAALAEAARAGLVRLIAAFDDPAMPYRSQPDPARAPRFPVYDHLARVQEWSVPGAGEGE